MRYQVNLFPLLENKWGYINDKGEWVINPKYDHALPFSQGLAIVRSNNNNFVIDESGTILNQIGFDEAYGFSCDRCAVRIDKHWGYIDTDMNFVVKPKFSVASYFSDFLALVDIIDYDDALNQYGYIDYSGDFRIMPTFDFAFDFQEGLAQVEKENRDGTVKGYIDSEGNLKIDLSDVPEISGMRSFSEGLASLMWGDYCGCIDKSGQWQIDPRYEFIGEFSSGLAKFREKDKWGYIDHSGKTVIQPHFDFASDFSEGFAVIGMGSLLQRTLKKGYIDLSGRIVVEPKYDIAKPFYQGLAYVGITDRCRGYIDQNENFVKKIVS